MLSAATISRIEKGWTSVSEESVEAYAKALGFNFDQLKNMFIPSEDIVHIKRKLSMVEYCVEQRHFESIDADLKQLCIPEDHPLQQVIHYIKGKAFFYMRKFDRSERELEKAISLSEKYADRFGHLNIVGCAYNILSNIYYWTKGVQPALEASQKSVKSFDLSGERLDILQMSLVNHANFLGKAEHYGQAEEALREIREKHWPITRPLVRAKFFELLAEQKRRNKEYEEALDCAYESLRIAGDDNLTDQGVHALLVIGDIHNDLGESDQAKISYENALRFKDKVKHKALVADAYARLGRLFTYLHEFSKAEESFQKANEVPDVDDYRQCTILLGVGDLLVKQQKFESAIPPLSQSLKLSRIHRLKEKEYDALSLLSDCYYHIDPQAELEHLRMMKQVDREIKTKRKEKAR